MQPADQGTERFPMEERTVPLDQLIPNPKNPRQHPREQLERLAESIRQFGQPKPVLARKANHMLIAGHGVWQAMRLAGKTEIRVTLWDLPQRQADAFLIADNRHAELGYTDSAKAAALLAEVDEELWLAVGYSDDEAEKLIQALEHDEIDLIEIETSAVSDRFWLVVRGPLEQQAHALQRLRELMAELPEVEVQLGTEQEG